MSHVCVNNTKKNRQTVCVKILCICELRQKKNSSQEAVYTNKPPFTIMYSIFGIHGSGSYHEVIIGN